MRFLPKDYPNYKELSKRTLTLTNLVTNLVTIEREDSLQKLANMTEKQRNEVIDKIIAKIIEAELKKQEEVKEDVFATK